MNDKPQGVEEVEWFLGLMLGIGYVMNVQSEKNIVGILKDNGSV